ncbi:MAG TPA: hypothetical protein VHX60_06780 [Acidobacteriaceae bacterium]|nr:hypothetical protein [Acidobacteriaceae bacterium]
MASLCALMALAAGTAVGQSTPPPVLPDAPVPAAAPVSPQHPDSGKPPEHPEQVRHPAAESTEVTVLENTSIRTMTEQPVSTNRARPGDSVVFTVTADVMVGDVVAIPRGATVRGTVIGTRKSGVLTGSPQLTLELTELDLGGRAYPLYTYKFQVTGLSKTKPTAKDAVRGAYVGALVAALAVNADGQATTTGETARAATAGAVVGAGVGTVTSAVSPDLEIRIPAEAEVEFTLADPITITPVTAREAARLAEGLLLGGPVLYVRGQTP